MMKDIRKIKQLQTQLSIMNSDAQALNNDNSVKISEHAIIRYMERVKGLNISDIEKQILTDEVLSLIDKLGGSGKYPVNNFQIVVKDYTITTVVQEQLSGANG